VGGTASPGAPPRGIRVSPRALRVCYGRMLGASDAASAVSPWRVRPLGFGFAPRPNPQMAEGQKAQARHHPATCGTDPATMSHPLQGTMTFPNGDTFEGEYVRSLDKVGRCKVELMTTR